MADGAAEDAGRFAVVRGCWVQRTDGLIDQIVYRLYGLTEQEIAVVEGRGA